MQEPIRINVPQVNGHGYHRGITLLSPDPPSAGFTAVNGMKTKSTAFQPVDTAISPHHTPGNDSAHRPASGITQYHAHGWRPADSDPPQGNHEVQQQQSAITGKRKRSDVQDIDEIRSTGPSGDRNDSIKRSSMTLDSAVDLTSPDNATESIALEAIDSDSSEQAGTYERQKTPVERWNQGDPPPKPRPETEASLAASVNQFQRQNQQAQGAYQARSITPHVHDISPPNEYDDIGEPHGLSDDQYNADGSDPKRRKRNFSNRTKTGCHTCRQRKKKCDEGKPTCQNCERSGHPCKGYGPKPPGEDKSTSQGRSVVPLQSKTPMAPYNNRNGDTSTRGEEGRSYSHWGRLPPQIPPPPPEPEHRAFIPVAPADPRRPNTADHWQKPAFPPQEPPPTYQNERLPPPPNFSQMPPPPPQQPYHPSQHPPPVTPQLHYAPPPPVQHHPPPPQPPPARQSAPPHPLHVPPEPWGHQPAPPPYPTPNGVGPPSLGSSRDSAQSGSNRSGPFGMEYGGGNRQIEKDKMLRGQPFLYYLDQFLLEERLNCKAAVERYNKAAEMTSGISRSERGKLFTQILKPFKRPHTEAPQTPHRGPVGSVGDHTIIETPFKCEFGYNIHIGKDCIIESGAYFQDAADIGIGSRVTIGHNVKLYTIAANIDVNARRGNHSQVIAGAIAVQDDSFLGADVIVLPFVTIGKGAVVGAGSVVTKDVEPYTIVAGNPAKLIRRIEGSNMGRHHSQQIQRQQEEMQRSMVEYANSGFNTTSPPLG